MGKDIIINSGDFSVNGFKIEIDINTTIFTVSESYSDILPTKIINVPDRCCFYLNIDSSYNTYNRIRMHIKNGFDYNFRIKNRDGVKCYKGNGIEIPFSWVTDTQEVIAPISQGDEIYVNLRYDDNTTVFDSNTTIDDIVNVLTKF